ncbi:toxin-activating lysine-acyltransferase [Hyphococcus sp.]|uniref:toxin-activating lysine-acyltransferase n=1 Tax=Hyphococcus sp. TaxID=2038636 RepID=UPI003CCB9C05
MSETPPNAESSKYRALQDKNPYAALGRAVGYLMTKPNFKELKFGFWSRTLAGQINRNHYFLAAEEGKIVGFVGWALVSEEMAKAWLNGNADFDSVDCKSGDCMVINAWAADTNAVNRFNLREIRRHLVGLEAAYAKRFYKNGRVRPLRVGITDLVEVHLEKGA